MIPEMINSQEHVVRKMVLGCAQQIHQQMDLLQVKRTVLNDVVFNV